MGHQRWPDALLKISYFHMACSTPNKHGTILLFWLGKTIPPGSIPGDTRLVRQLEHRIWILLKNVEVRKCHVVGLQLHIRNLFSPHFHTQFVCPQYCLSADYDCMCPPPLDKKNFHVRTCALGSTAWFGNPHYEHYLQRPRLFPSTPSHNQKDP